MNAIALSPVAWDRSARIGEHAWRSLIDEVETWPKPGLVSPLDSGAHEDMDVNTFRRSAAALRPFFVQLAQAGRSGAGFERLRDIGIAAERAMLQATNGVNTHRGAIFALGLLCAAAGDRDAHPASPRMPLGSLVKERWGEAVLARPAALRSHGQAAWLRYGAGGARREAALGFPTVYKVGLPALWNGERIASGDLQAARAHAAFALIAAVEDTNLMHRGGRQGLAFAQACAHRFLRDGGVGAPRWRARALAIHEAFKARRLSPGGAADLLACCLFVRELDGPAWIGA